MKSLKEVDLENKKVLVRVDFNIPINDGGVVDNTEDWRIKATLPSLQYLIKKKAKIILMAHLGRPEGKVVENLRLDPVKNKLKDLLGLSVTKLPDCVGSEVSSAVQSMKAGEIILLENLRFYKEEEANDEKFAKSLAALADVYVNDAFSASHRAHASICAITKFLPSYAGPLLEKEVEILSKAISKPKRPATIIIGGAKAETKFPVIKYLLGKFDHILVGGVVANVILKAKGIDTGKSMLGGIDPEEAKKINLEDKKLYIPVDMMVCNSVRRQIALSAVGKIGDDRILDIGPETSKLYSKIISDSKLIIWNGPMGLFEKEGFAGGTKEITKAVAGSRGYSIIGGGDTITAVEKFGYADQMDYICTGGGAMLEFLSGENLPGLEVLGGTIEVEPR